MTITASQTTSTLVGFMSGSRTWMGHAAEARKYEGEVPREDALALLSFPVQEFTPKVPVITEDGVDEILDERHKGILRVDTREVFEYFSPGYRSHGYPDWLVRNVDALIDGGLRIGTVALTEGGARAILQAEMPHDRIATAPGAEPVPNRPHISAMTSLDGSIATTYGIGTRVLVCENELGLAGFRNLVKGFSRLKKYRHTSGSNMRMLEAREALGLVAEEIGDAFDVAFRTLVAEHVSEQKFRDVVDAATGRADGREGRSLTMAENKGRVLENLWRNDARVAPWKNSAYGVLAAFNTAQHHEFGADKKRTERNFNATIRDQWVQHDSKILSLLASV